MNTDNCQAISESVKDLKPNGKVTVTTYQDGKVVIGVLPQEARTPKCRFLSDGSVLNIETGEVTTYEPSEFRSLNSITRSLRDCRKRCFNNFQWHPLMTKDIDGEGYSNMVHLVLTLEPLSDNIKWVQREWCKFLDRAKYSNLFGAKFEYCYVIHPHDKVTDDEKVYWHIHALLFYEGKPPELGRFAIQSKWGHGVADIIIPESKEHTEKTIGYVTSSKPFANLASEGLLKIPRRVQVARTSLALENPVKESIFKSEAEEKYGVSDGDFIDCGAGSMDYKVATARQTSAQLEQSRREYRAKKAVERNAKAEAKVQAKREIVKAKTEQADTAQVIAVVRTKPRLQQQTLLLLRHILFWLRQLLLL